MMLLLLVMLREEVGEVISLLMPTLTQEAGALLEIVVMPQTLAVVGTGTDVAGGDSGGIWGVEAPAPTRAW